MKVKASKFTKNHGLHGNGRFSRKTANFTENVTAVKSWIRLVPTHEHELQDMSTRIFSVPLSDCRRPLVLCCTVYCT